MGWHIHPSARVDRSATVDDSCQIMRAALVGPRAFLCSGVTVGPSSKVAMEVYAGFDVRIGEDCQIGRGALLAEGTTLEKGVRIGPYAILRNEIDPRAIQCDGLSAGGPSRRRPRVLVREGAIIEPGAIVNAGLVIGHHARVTAGSVVTEDVADFALATGNPAKVVGRVCPEGHPMRRRGARAWHCAICDEEVEMGRGRKRKD